MLFKDLKVGMLVEDTWWPNKFGIGTVVNIDPSKALINFPGCIHNPLVYDKERTEDFLFEWKHTEKK